MSSAWVRASGFTRWWDHDYGGVQCSLAHLHPFKLITTLSATEAYPARTIELRVGFSCHVFTRAGASGDAGAKAYLTEASEPRMFCPDRHALSALLPDIVRGLPRRNDCFYAKHQNYFVVEVPGRLPANEEYRVFFNVRKADVPETVRVFVESAYTARKGSGPNSIAGKKVGFRVILNLALQNKRPVPTA